MNDAVTIGLISDTHGYFDESLVDHFRDCDEIWHAGDIGSLEIISRLSEIKPVICVYGNIDDTTAQRQLPEDCWLTRGGMTFLMTHIAGRPPRYTPRVKKLLTGEKVDALVCGHSHICEVKNDPSNGIIFINPGAAGQHGFHAMRTVLRISVADGKMKKLEVIELGKRGKI